MGYYRRKADWKTVLRLLPTAIAGVFLALWVDHLIPATEFKHLMGGCLALVLVVMLWSQWKGKENMLADHWWYGPLFGLLGGFMTLQQAWSIVDLAMAFMTILNLTAVLLLSRYAFRLLRDFKEQRRQGKEPVFNPDLFPEADLEGWR